MPIIFILVICFYGRVNFKIKSAYAYMRIYLFFGYYGEKYKRRRTVVNKTVRVV